MTPTTQREKIFQFIQSRKQATAQEIANWFKLPVTTIRFHLRVLVNADRIRADRSTRIRTLGKPRLVYQVIEQTSQEMFKGLLDTLLKEAEIVDGLREPVLALMAKRVFGDATPKSGNLTLNLIDLIDAFNDHDYTARWEVHRSAPRVILENCPYLGSDCVVSHFCEMDRRVIEKWTGRVVSQTQRLDLMKRGGACVFEFE